MKQIDRLLRYAKKMHSSAGKSLLVSIEYRDDLRKFVAGGTEYDSKGVSCGKGFLSEHDTLQDALSAVDMLTSQYQSANKITFIIDDLTFPEGVTMDGKAKNSEAIHTGRYSENNI